MKFTEFTIITAVILFLMLEGIIANNCVKRKLINYKIATSSKI